MTIQSSGQISFLDLQNEFGDTGDWLHNFRGSNPIAMNEYYRGAINEIVTEYTPTVSGSSGTYWQTINNSSASIVSNGSNVATGLSGTSVSHTIGNTTYLRHTLGATNTYGSTTVRKYYLRKYVSGNVNDAVPTSGQISLGDFYGTSRA